MKQLSIDYSGNNLGGKWKQLLSLLKTKPLTSVEIRESINTCCPGTDIADLRKKGLKIKCEYIGMSLRKKKIFLYTLDKESLPCI
jgi:hypothetical protein